MRIFSSFKTKILPIKKTLRSEKVFCVGYNKTGTTTVELLLKHYGYILPDQAAQERALSTAFLKADFSNFVNFASDYDAFQDMPFSQGDTYIAAAALFPESKFILTERDSDAWFSSMTSFHMKVFGLASVSKLTEQDVLERFDYLYPGYVHEVKKYFLTNFVGDVATVRWDLLYDKAYYVEEYLARNNRIKKFFQNCPERLLIIDVTAESNTKKICQFLNISSEQIIDMPHANKT